MPTYEYACSSCDEHLEVVQSFSDDPLTTCPRCGGPLRKVFGAVGIVLKGSGFYRNDSRSTSSGARPGAKSRDAAGKEAGKEAGGSSSGGGSGESSGAAASTGTDGGTKSGAASPSPTSAAAG